MIRKTALVLTTALFCLSLQANEQAPAYQAPRAKQAPLLDAKADDPAWRNAAWKVMDQLMAGTQPTAADFSGRFKAVWTEHHLYLLAEITDDILFDQHPDPLYHYWDDDALEVFIDEDRSGGPHQFDYNAFAYHIALDNQAVDIGPFESEQDEKAGKLNFRSYPHHVQSVWQRAAENPHVMIWEARFALYPDTYRDHYPAGQSPVAPVRLYSGKNIGFMVAYCDNDGSETREHFVGDVDFPPVNGDRNLGYIDASVFGELVLID